MATATDTSLDDIAQAIADLSTMTAMAISDLRSEMKAGFRRLDGRMDDIERRMNTLESNQRETNQRLAQLEGSYEALEDDVKELYRLIHELGQDYKTFTAEERERFAHFEDFAHKVSRKTGIPFTLG